MLLATTHGVDPDQCKWPASRHADSMTDLDLRLRCEHHIADLIRRINQLKETSASIASAEYIELLQKTLESWQEQLNCHLSK